MEGAALAPIRGEALEVKNTSRQTVQCQFFTYEYESKERPTPLAVRTVVSGCYPLEVPTWLGDAKNSAYVSFVSCDTTVGDACNIDEGIESLVDTLGVSFLFNLDQSSIKTESAVNDSMKMCPKQTVLAPRNVHCTVPGENKTRRINLLTVVSWLTFLNLCTGFLSDDEKDSIVLLVASFYLWHFSTWYDRKVCHVGGSWRPVSSIRMITS